MHHDHQPGQRPDPQHGQGGPVRLDQLQPGEAEQGQRRRPDPDPAGQPEQALLRVHAGQPAQPVVDGPQRVGRPPEPAEQQRDRHQPDPHPDEDEAEDGVGQQVLAGHQGQAGPGVRGQHQQSRDQPDDRMVDDPGQSGQRPPAQLGEPRLPPGQQQHHEREREGQRGADHHEGEGQRQVVPGRDPVQRYQHQCAGRPVSGRSRSTMAFSR